MKSQEITDQAARYSASAPQAWIEITKVFKAKSGHHVAEYAIHDNRPWFMDAGLGYTRSAGRSIDPTAEVVDPSVQIRYSIEAAQQRDEAKRKRREAEDPKRRQRRIGDRVRAAMTKLSTRAEIALEESIEHLCVKAESEGVEAE